MALTGLDPERVAREQHQALVDELTRAISEIEPST
jgi:phenylpyruvate tautomerase PptA (4-oxalocrotonate tautomerase family)